MLQVISHYSDENTEFQEINQNFISSSCLSSPLLVKKQHYMSVLLIQGHMSNYPQISD